MAHVLFMDIVAYSTLPIEQQRSVLNRLQQSVCTTAAFTQAHGDSNLICLPTGDGMALVFFGDPEQPIACALELSRSIRHTDIRLRMGIHTGLVYRVADINQARNVAGGGINMAQRVMDCGDAGHILVSKIVADMLAEVSAWSNVIRQDLGEVEVKHGVRLHLYNLFTDDAGNPNTPQKQLVEKEARARTRRRKAILALAVAIAAIGTMSIFTYEQFHRLPAQKHIAVLPFQSVGNEAEDKAFTDGEVENLTSKLSQLERFQQSFWVVPSSDARKVTSLNDAYRNLNASLAVTGSIQHTGNGVIVNANLVDAQNHRQLDSRTIRAPAGNLDELQDKVWESVADMVNLQITPEMARSINAGGTKQPGAYELYVQGLGYLQRFNVESIDHAIEVFGKALQKDPEYAVAYAGLGQAYSTKYVLTKDPQWIAKAISNGRRAIELDPGLSAAHLALGRVYQQTGELNKALDEFHQGLQQDPTMVQAEYHIAEIYDVQGKLPEAEAAYKWVIDRRPEYPLGYSGLGSFYDHHGQFDKAEQQFKAMLELQPDNSLAFDNLGGVYTEMGRYQDAVNILNEEPAKDRSASTWNNLGADYIYLKRYPEAAEALKKATELAPHNHVLWRNLGDAYSQVPGEEAQVKAAYQKALQTATEDLGVNPKDSDALSSSALYHAHLGHTRDAEQLINKALQLSPRDTNVLFTAALVYEIIGNRKQALDMVFKAYDAGSSLSDIEADPELGALRQDSRYQQWAKGRANTRS